MHDGGARHTGSAQEHSSGMEKHSQAEVVWRGKHGYIPPRVRLDTAVQGLGSKGPLSKCL